MTPYWETHEAWREKVVAQMFCTLPYKQKEHLFHPDREFNKLNYWTSWLEGACIHWGGLGPCPECLSLMDPEIGCLKCNK